MEQSFKTLMLFLASSCLLWLSASAAPTAYAGDASLVTEFPTSETGTGTTKDIKDQTNFTVRIVKDGNEIENEPAYLVTGHGYRLLPFRTVAEGVGFTVIWNQATHSAEVRKDESWTTVQKDTDYYQYNDMEPISLGIAPVIIDGSLYVLEDYFSDVLQLSVELEQGTDALIISQDQ
ncbi:copper amine oxidase N-terminal domain-containing protein [Paenibacillus jiagnxiensis]|uniref:copper amine oxidase N-terminal domain-containing protein n=1 Tax=Paenibacillus jiagnxiensis TaxID=3228926 RepID=UPI0033B5E90C